MTSERHFQNESYIPQLFTRKFSPRETKCLKGVAVGDQDSQYLWQNHSENSPNMDYLTIVPLKVVMNPFL